MNQRQNTIGQRCTFTGLLIQAASIITIKSVEHPSRAGFAAAIALIIGTIAYIAGLAYYAKAKGYRAAWCALGLFSLFGLTIIMALPDLEP